MRLLALLLLAVAASAADYESITLKDGRTLVGIYDHGTLTMEDGKVSLPIAEADIVARAPAAAPIAKPTSAKPAPRSTLNAYQEMTARATALRDDAKATQGKADDLEAAFFAEWVSHADLSPLPVPALSADPRKSEKDAADQVRRLNMQLTEFASDHQRLADEKAYAAKHHGVTGGGANHNERSERFRNFFEGPSYALYLAAGRK